MTMQNNAIEIAKVLSEKKARDITVINIAEKSSFADFFINATAGSDRQLSALLDFAEGKAAELGLEQKNVEGIQGSGWLLADYGDIIINLFTAETRDKYTLDKIWSDCEIVFVEE
jgi:iojap-like protein